MALSGKLREKFQAFSTVFVAGAIATYYFTVYIAYQQYGLLGQTGGFSILVLCTLLSVWLSLKYNQQELALLSLAGGFITPFMV
ncbi:DUF2339 domain-containing protein, partial [Umezakia ovalisporum]|uniref:DUF2339 domain-containing protein n=1 Tax=Umezakia ovalisporum TaxID=75695 RepID=UPI0039C6F3D6